MNITSLVMQFLGPMIVNKLATSFGIPPSAATKIVSVLVPAILAGLVGKAAQPGGARALVDVLGKQDTDALGRYGDAIGGAEQGRMVEAGSAALGSLLGTSTLGSLVAAAAKYTGIGEGPSTGLAGILGTAVLGTIATQQKASGLDAAGLASLLEGQKQSIAAAIPSDFAGLLGGTGLLDSVMPAKPAAPAAGAMPAKAAAAPARPADRPASNMQWMPWLALIAAAAIAWFYLFAVPKSGSIALPQPPRIEVAGTNVGGQLGTAVDTLRSALGSVRDVGSANAALPRLREAAGELDRIGGIVSSLNSENRKAIASYLGGTGGVIAILKPIVDDLLRNSSLGPVLRPVLERVMARLGEMSKA